MNSNEKHPNYLVLLVGGTVLKLPGGRRGPDCAYDKLLALLDQSEVRAPKGVWLPGKQAFEGAAMMRSESGDIASEILADADLRLSTRD